MPFVDVGAGLVATGIGPPDLGGTAQFNLGGGVGTHYFVRDQLALELGHRFLHVSNADNVRANGGVNLQVLRLGLDRFF